MKLLEKWRSRYDNREPRAVMRRDNHSFNIQILTLIILSLLITFTLEIFNRHGLVRVFVFIWEAPLNFLLNWLLVANTLALAQLFKRRIAVLVMVCLFWITFAVTNFVVTTFRTQPFTLADVMLVKDMFSLITVYFTWWQIGMIALGIIAVIGTIVLMFIKAPKRESVNYRRTLLAFAVLTVISVGSVRLMLNAGMLQQRFPSLKDAYNDYGFAYTFIDTFADLGISRPKDYSSHTVKNIVNVIDDSSEGTARANQRPNIIYVQLESFFDDAALSDEFVLSESATPIWHQMLKDYPSGTLYVPVVGGGTANTEFEMLTGMNLDFFGAGEYPYYTVLRDTPCESVCYVLNRIGYTSTAVHNYMATFYGRNEVYARLGFNRFESMEYMDDLSYGEVGWAFDDELIDSILAALDTTEGRDFIAAITVSTHGKYPSDYLLDCAVKGVQVLQTDEYVNAYQLQNFLNLAKELDNFIGELTDALVKYPEPIVVVFYGDHMPAIEWENTSVKSGNLYETQYCIWTNYGRTFDAPDLQAYRVTANLLKQLGIEDGVIFRYHQAQPSFEESVGYLTELEILEYDMLYGDLEVFKGEIPFEATDLQMGIHEIRITSAECRFGRLIVKGTDFNEFSEVIIDDRTYDTAYIDEHTLAVVMDELPEDAENLYVAQVTNEEIELTRTDPFPCSKVVGKGRRN